MHSSKKIKLIYELYENDGKYAYDGFTPFVKNIIKTQENEILILKNS